MFVKYSKSDKIRLNYILTMGILLQLFDAAGPW